MHVRCRKCSNEWNAIPAQLLSGYGCRKCGTEKAHLGIRKTQAEIVKQMSDINTNIEVIGKYKSRHNKVLVRCKYCGNEWNADAGSLLSRRGCPKCSRKMAANQVRKSHDIYVNQLREVNPSIEVIGKYVKNHEPIEVKCRICTIFCLQLQEVCLGVKAVLFVEGSVRLKEISEKSVVLKQGKYSLVQQTLPKHWD